MSNAQLMQQAMAANGRIAHHVISPHLSRFSALDLGGIGLVDARLALAQHLDFSAEQHHAGLDCVLDEVVVPRPAILRGVFVGVAAHHA